MTVIGWIWVMTTRPVASEARTMLPSSTMPDAGASGDRRDDVGVGEDRAGVVDRGLVGFDLRLELGDQRALGVDLLLVDRIDLPRA